LHHYDHIFVIMMENHGYQQIYWQPQPAIHEQHYPERQSQSRKELFLEVVGGSNFSIRSDNSPD